MKTPIALALAACIAVLLLLVLSWQDGSPQLLRVSRSPADAAVSTAVAPASSSFDRVPTSPHGAATGASSTPTVQPAASGVTGDGERPATLPATGELLLPVAGVHPKDLQDTFTDARSAGRSHDAIDIMAPAGTPVFAVADGHVEKLFDSARGGLTIYQFEPGGKLAYYYAHLQRYADGLAEGQPVKRGQVIGYVGSTGNASPSAPHLHFAIFVLGPDQRWWEGTAINPYPLLRGPIPGGDARLP